MGNIIQQAVEVAQDLDVRVFPVDKDKRPTVKGWREKATSDPEEIRRLFTGAAGIGVPCGPDNDIICFDVDFGHTQDEDRLAKLHAWVGQYQEDIEESAMVRKTRSGGLHIIYAWPSAGRPPRRIMPKLDVIIDGFYFVWAMEDGSYEWLQGEVSDEPPEGMCDVVESGTLGTGSALMSAEEAHEAMWSDGDAGVRHDALLRMTQDWAGDLPGKGVREWCSSFETWFRDIYGDRIEASRLDKLLEWDVENERGELYRAFKGVSTTEAHATELLAAAGAKLKSEGRLPATPAPKSEKNLPDRGEREEAAEKIAGEFTQIDLNELAGRQLDDIDWIVDDLLPAGNLVSITGPSGAGKTRFNAMLMAALSTGNTDKVGLPRAARAINSLYIANEERTADVERRLKAAATLNDLRGDMLITVRGKEHGRFHLVGPDGQVLEEVVDKMIDVVREKSIDLLMIDPVVTIGIEDENTASQVDVAMGALQNIASATGCCVLYVHHSPKDRHSPEDTYRGDSSAWRGSGVFYSSLDLGVTLMPWLPEECHDKQNGKANRRKWSNMIRNHAAPKYVILDSAKERENEGLASTLYEIVGQEVRVGGRKIGAMRHVTLAEAQNTATQLLAQAEGIDEAMEHDWAAKLLEMHPEEGTHKTSLRKIGRWFDEVSTPVGWDTRRNRDEAMRFDRGSGKRIFDALSKTHNVAGTWVYLTHEGGSVVCHVSRVS